MANQITNGVRALFPFLDRPSPVEVERTEPVVQPVLTVTLRHGMVQSAALDGEPVAVAVRDYDMARRRRQAFEELPIDDEGHRFVESVVPTDL